MDLDYEVISEDASNLVEDEIVEGDFDEFTGFSYDFYKFVDYFN